MNGILMALPSKSQAGMRLVGSAKDGKIVVHAKGEGTKGKGVKVYKTKLPEGVTATSEGLAALAADIADLIERARNIGHGHAQDEVRRVIGIMS